MNNKKMNNKGFTLVELIVVLVILAILAAILVPALLGYIDRARGAQYLLNAKSVLTAAQAEASNCYGTAGTTDAGAKETIEDLFDEASVAATADIPVGAKFTVVMKEAKAEASPKNHGAWTVCDVVYKENGVIVYYDGKNWEQNLTDEPSTYKGKGKAFTYTVPAAAASPTAAPTN